MHRAENNASKQFFVDAGKDIPSRCLVMVQVFTDRPTDTTETVQKKNASNNVSMVVRVPCRGNMLPSNYNWNTHTDRQSEQGDLISVV
jgi:hypothetical protein